MIRITENNTNFVAHIKLAFYLPDDTLENIRCVERYYTSNKSVKTGQLNKIIELIPGIIFSTVSVS